MIDCWMMEVMPPGWILAYNRLLTLGDQRTGRRRPG
jgi:hypothetical protein